MTTKEIFAALRGFYPSAEAMNKAIGIEWLAVNYQGLRMESAQRLLEKRRQVYDIHDHVTRDYQQTVLL